MNSFYAEMVREGDEVIIALRGDLDETAAPFFHETLLKAAEHNPRIMTLRLRDLDYISSAGIRSLAYARQQMDTEVQIIVEDANDQAADMFRVAEMDESVILRSSTPEDA